MLESAVTQPDASHGESLSYPASHCPKCNTPLKIWHKIPLLSFFLLGQRCFFCKTPISWQYPLVESLNTALWLVCAWHWGLTPTALCWAFAMSFLLTLSTIDWQTTYLPDALTLPLLWLGLLASSLGFIHVPLAQAVWGAVAGYGTLWVVATAFAYIAGKEGMGGGDFKLLAALGAWLGPMALIPVVLVASICGALVGLWMQSTQRMAQGGYLPFGPFLATAGVLEAFYGASGIFFT
jgi:leader peptidase (prepilin peptidase)/N-methyltransferase